MILTAIIFLLVLSSLVFIHEFGHFMVARFIGVKVEEFGFGLPPRIFGKKIRGTLYSLNWLPIGGFVRLAGEDEDGSSHKSKVISQKQERHFFWARSKKERAAILLAGVTMNFVLACAITAGLLISGVPESSGRVHIEKVVAGSPADLAGLRAGDIITRVTPLTPTGRPHDVKVPKDLIDVVKANTGSEIAVSVLRDGKGLVVSVVPRAKYPVGEGPTGVAISDLETKKYPITQAPIEAVRINLIRGKDMFVSIVTTIVKLVSFQPVAGDVAGPIGIAQVTGQAARYGIKALLEFVSILSLNLAVLNVLPIPALDGGRLAFVVLEKVLGRKIHPAWERNAHQIGMLILLFLVVLVSINDILRLARGS